MFSRKGVLKICSKFTGENPCRSVISIKLLCNFMEITFRRGCSPVNLLHIFRRSFLGTPLGGCFWIGFNEGDISLWEFCKYKINHSFPRFYFSFFIITKTATFSSLIFILFFRSTFHHKQETPIMILACHRSGSAKSAIEPLVKSVEYVQY